MKVSFAFARTTKTHIRRSSLAEDNGTESVCSALVASATTNPEHYTN